MRLNFVRAGQLCDNLGLHFNYVRGFKLYREVYDFWSDLLLLFGFGNVPTFTGQLFPNI
jgi:hypothetical protein